MDWKAPKSLRQIGDTKGKTQIYVEDYVMSFAKKLARQQRDVEIAGVLLGRRFYHSREKIFLVSGMVSIKDFHLRGSDIFTQEMWTSIYTDIKENFTDLDVVGWFYSGGRSEAKMPEGLLGLHRRNFSDADRLLYIYEQNGCQDDFYLYRDSAFSKQGGYYIYYEKNMEMRNYMMEEANRFVHIVEQEDDRVIRNIRGVLRENEERKKEKEAEGKWTFGLASLVLVLGLALGAIALNNQNGLAELKNQIAGLQDALKGDEQKTETDKTTVETIGGGVVTMAAVSGQAMQEQESPSAVPADVPGTDGQQVSAAEEGAASAGAVMAAGSDAASGSGVSVQ